MIGITLHFLSPGLINFTQQLIFTISNVLLSSGDLENLDVAEHMK